MNVTPVLSSGTPVPQPSVLEIARSERRKRVRSAAVLARRVYPGPVGDILAHELNAWDEYGHLLYDMPENAPLLRLVEHLEQLEAERVAA